MATLETLGWSALGASASSFLIYLLPGLRRLLDNEAQLHLRRILVAIIIMIIFFGLGAGLTLAIGDVSQPKHAVFFAAGWESLIKGTGEGGSLIGRQMASES